MIRRIVDLLCALLRELSDEAPYERHLAVHGVAHSPAEWRRFCDEKWAAKSKRGRCC
jgi:hypothetical protein